MSHTSRTAIRLWIRGMALAAGITIALFLVVSAKPAGGAASPARTADEFVNSIGLSAHVSWLNTPYGDYAAWKPKLEELGVKHVRDAAVSPKNKTVYSRYRDLYKTQDVKWTLNFSYDREWSPTVNSSTVNSVINATGGGLEAIEGPNEPNNGSNSNWKQDTIEFQKDLFNAVNASSDPSIPVLNAPMKRPYDQKADGSVDFSAYPDLSDYSDYANMHSYPAGHMPTGGHRPGQSLLLDNDIPMAQHVGGKGKPITSTETGYTNGLKSWNGISEEASAKYTPRLSFEYFNAGVKRAHFYELIDSQSADPDGINPLANLGLLRRDLSEKPAFQALENTIDILQDPGPSFRPGSLDYALGGDTKNVHRTLLQKRDGSFYLVLWQEVSSYDRTAKRDISVPSRKVTLTLNQSIKSANVYRPNRSASQLKTYSSPKHIALDVPDEVLIVKLTPSDSTGAVRDPDAESNTAPRIFDEKPGKDSRTKDRTPTISAKVQDGQVDLSKSDTLLFVDGRRKTNFTYDSATNRLKYTRQKSFEVGTFHQVKIVARDPHGPDTTERWGFKVVR